MIITPKYKTELYGGGYFLPEEVSVVKFCYLCHR